jgi:hypothetical protein
MPQWAANFFNIAISVTRQAARLEFTFQTGTALVKMYRWS